MNKFTPGPWMHKSYEAIGDKKFCSQTGRPITPGRMIRVYSNSKSFIHSTYAYFDEIEELEANACLMAAGPELLEACRHAVVRLKELDKYRETDSSASIGLIEKAIAKAMGGSDL